MTQVLTSIAALAVFAAIYAALKRHPNWSRGEDGAPYGAPGWWRPLAVGWFAILALFVLYAAVEHGFHWGMLLVFPILGGAFALGVLLLKLVGRT